MNAQKKELVKGDEGEKLPYIPNASKPEVSAYADKWSMKIAIAIITVNGIK